MTAIRLLTAQQVCERFGIPEPATLRTMRAKGLAAVRLGKAYLYDEADIAAFIERSKVCHAPTQAPGSTGTQREEATISAGMSAARSGSDQRALLIAKRLKKRSPRSSAEVIALPAARASQAR